jgi:hypothetical protein
MDAATAVTITTAVVGAAATILGIWLHWRADRRRAREALRRDYLHLLPPGSRIVDLGGRGTVIDVGGRGARREDLPDGTP